MISIDPKCKLSESDDKDIVYTKAIPLPEAKLSFDLTRYYHFLVINVKPRMY